MNMDMAKQTIVRAIELNPNNFNAYLNLGVAMSQAGDKAEDIISTDSKGETAAINNMADDITIGKLKMFTGHNYLKLDKKNEAKAKYDEAKPYFEKNKTNSIKEVADFANRWLQELEDHYKRLE